MKTTQQKFNLKVIIALVGLLIILMAFSTLRSHGFRMGINFHTIVELSILVALIVGIYLFIRTQKLNRLVNIRAYSKVDKNNKEEKIEAITSKVTFNDVAGITDVKEELEEIIDFLKYPKKYRDLGIRLPKGVLLIGPPGVGKTLIAKAVAGEANVPFFYQSGASFVHLYVGMGAKRVTQLFQQAKAQAPSIVFIDEIDAVGKSRGGDRNDEREATLNQLLTEMDGFEDSSGVMVIGATNRVEMLDSAIIRAGRFDRRVHIELPGIEDRAKTLELYLKGKAHNVDIEKIAKDSVGFSAAALDTLTNEAALNTLKDGRKIVETSDFEAVRDKVLLGKRKLINYSEENKKIESIYQASKAVIATWLDVEFDKVSLVNSRRLILSQNEILSKTKLLSRIKVYIAGTVATKHYFEEQYSSGSDDIVTAKEILKRVINDYMMTEDFIVSNGEENALMHELTLETKTLVTTLNKAIDSVAKHLLEYEVISFEECKKILKETI